MSVTYPASVPQVQFINTLLADRVVATEAGDRLRARLGDGTLTSRDASDAIAWLKRQPFVNANANVVDDALTQGVYQVDGQIYVVKPNRSKTRLYAKRLVEINADRLTETDEVVQIEFEYEPGAIYRIKPEHRMPVEQGKALTIRYGKCICCGRKLKAAQSVERGIGPICIKYFG